jgi:hypothetical protein
MEVTDFERDHPEREEGEVFVTNSNTMRFVGWKTKRKGKIPYDVHGNQNYPKGWFPIFAQIEDVRQNSTLTDGEELIERMLPKYALEEMRKTKEEKEKSLVS